MARALIQKQWIGTILFLCICTTSFGCYKPHKENIPSDIAFYGNYAFVNVVESNTGLAGWSGAHIRVFDMQNPLKPDAIENYDLNNACWNLKTYNGYLFSKAHYGFDIFRIDNSGELKLANTYISSWNNRVGFDISGNSAYVLDNYGFKIIDFSNMSDIHETGLYQDMGFHGQNIIVHDNTAYISAHEAGLVVFDFSNASNITLVNSFSDVDVFGMWLDYPKLYTAGYQGGFHVLDVSNSSDIKVIGEFPSGDAYGIWVLDNIALCEDGIEGLIIIDFSDPSNPILLDRYEHFNDIAKVGFYNGVAVILRYHDKSVKMETIQIK
jgi:hypothetical protein